MDMLDTINGATSDEALASWLLENVAALEVGAIVCIEVSTSHAGVDHKEAKRAETHEHTYIDATLRRSSTYEYTVAILSTGVLLRFTGHTEITDTLLHNFFVGNYRRPCARIPSNAVAVKSAHSHAATSLPQQAARRTNSNSATSATAVQAKSSTAIRIQQVFHQTLQNAHLLSSPILRPPPHPCLPGTLARRNLFPPGEVVELVAESAAAAAAPNAACESGAFCEEHLLLWRNNTLQSPTPALHRRTVRAQDTQHHPSLPRLSLTGDAGTAAGPAAVEAKAAAFAAGASSAELPPRWRSAAMPCPATAQHSHTSIT